VAVDSDVLIVTKQLAQWFPIRIYAREAQTMVDWCRLGDERFDEPFFSQTVLRCLRHPFNLAFRKQTPIEALPGCLAAEGRLEPSGFIFHLSRSGSTLVGRTLGALDGAFVISEPPPVDTILRASLPGANDETRAEWLRGLIGALGRRWQGNERRYFVKFDAWAARHVGLIARAFPGVPWIFLYRDPLEVVVSHQRQVTYFMSPDAAPSFFGIDVASAVRIPPFEYQARVLAQIMQDVLESNPEPKRLVNYNELPSAIWDRVAPLFGVVPTGAEVERMRALAGVDVKAPSQRFQPDAGMKWETADAALRAAVDRYARPLYEELERQRLLSRAGA